MLKQVFLPLMQFVYPNFLWALLLIAVPVIIHLFYFRRYKKVLFSNVSLLNEVKDERATKNRLKHLLVLLTRIFAILFLVLAFAQPFLNKGTKALNVSKNISIYVDNSFSMNAEGNSQLLLDEAKETAKEIILSQSKNDINNSYKYQILSNDFEGKHQRLVDKSEALSLLKEIKISAANRSLKSVYERQKTIFKDKSIPKEIVQISDFQSNNILFENDTSIETSLVKLQAAEVRNVYIDSVWFSHPVQLKNVSNKMIVRFYNESNEAIEGNYQLSLNGSAKTVGTYKIPKNSFVLDTLIFKIDKTGWNSGKVQLSDYPIVFDDKFYFSFYVEEAVNVQCISGEKNDNLFQAVFKGIENIDFKSTAYRLVDYNQLSKNHFIILDRIEALPSGLSQALKQYVKHGGNLFVVPHKNARLETYNTLLSSLNVGRFVGVDDSKRSLSKLNLQHYILNDLFEKKPTQINLPQVAKSLRFSSSVNSSEELILSFRNQDTYLSSFKAGNGTVYLLTSSVDLSSSDFKTHSIFAPILYKMSILSVRNAHLSFPIDANTEIILTKNLSTQKWQPEDVIKLRNESSIGQQNEYIPQKKRLGGMLTLNILNANLEAGIYAIYKSKNYSKDDILARVALNYNRKESALAYYTQKQLEAHYKAKNINVFSGNINQVKEKIVNNQNGKPLWKWFIIISLLFLAFEIILLRILK